MRSLSEVEATQVGGSGWLMFVFPIVVGFITGGPAGAVIGAGTVIAAAGAKNLEHLSEHGRIPTIHQIVN